MKFFTAWMEVLANIGVLAGIIFLTIEVSQNTLATKSEASLAIQTSISESISDLSSNPEVFDVIAKVYAEEELTEKERLLASFRFHSTLTMMEGALMQYQLGVIDMSVINSFDDELYELTHSSEFARWNWKNQANSFSPQMQRHVAEVIARETKNRT
ncbi:hypothetical protein E2F43_14925 [Seongchinamella unica]|uniref:Uncharacterized protein n=1 Tax=Seongchinamella unica TaxID=2547392 RepID=A0A4R5LQN6_9GAMM|nr:hypothetical protein [Seongchinamella unica]TDG12850.1 hypothetical protein E2F43_14925 [Seongchinamella unica]